MIGLNSVVNNICKSVEYNKSRRDKIYTTDIFLTRALRIGDYPALNQHDVVLTALYPNPISTGRKGSYYKFLMLKKGLQEGRMEVHRQDKGRR